MWCIRSVLRLSFTVVVMVSFLSLVVLLREIHKRGKTASVFSSLEYKSGSFDVRDDPRALIDPYFDQNKSEWLEFDSSDSQADWNVGFTSKPAQSSSSSARNLSTANEESSQQVTFSDPSRRKSLLIFGADRCGTTFISRIFGEDPQVFMVYEPLWVTKYWNNKVEGNWTNSELEVISGILSCKFADFPRATQFLAHTSRNWAVAHFKNPFQSPDFCNVSKDGKKLCPDLSSVPKFVEHICSTKYKHSVTKVAQVRAPDKSLGSLIPKIFQENPDTDIKVLQILRDPRGIFESRIQIGWLPKNTTPAFAKVVRQPCQTIAKNVKFGRNLSEKYKNRYMEVYYRDIALTPVKTVQKIYNFAGFEMSDELIKWIVLNTNPSEEALAKEARNTFSSVRNSTANVDKWRLTATKERVQMIERECSELMELLGLPPEGATFEES